MSATAAARLVDFRLQGCRFDPTLAARSITVRRSFMARTMARRATPPEPATPLAQSDESCDRWVVSRFVRVSVGAHHHRSRAADVIARTNPGIELSQSYGTRSRRCARSELGPSICPSPGLAVSSGNARGSRGLPGGPFGSAMLPSNTAVATAARTPAMVRSTTPAPTAWQTTAASTPVTTASMMPTMTGEPESQWVVPTRLRKAYVCSRPSRRRDGLRQSTAPALVRARGMHAVAGSCRSPAKRPRYPPRSGGSASPRPG